jgi:hypothetical protein
MFRFADREPGRRKPKNSTSSFASNGVTVVEESSRGFQSRFSRNDHHSEEHQGVNEDSVSSGGFGQLLPNRTTLFAGLVVTIGTVAAMLFLGFGVSGAVREQQIQFDLRAGELMSEIQAAFADYETASLWVHEACRSGQITRAEFRNVYEYMVHGGLEVEVCVVLCYVCQELHHFLKVPGAHRFVFLIHCLC